MIVTKLLLAALGLSAYAVAQGQDIQDQDVQYEDVVLDAWPMDPNNVLPTGTVTVRWDVKNGRDLEWSYNRGWCYNQATRYIQGYTIWADRYVSIDTWEKVDLKGQKWSPPLEGPTNGKVKWGTHKVTSVCLSG